AAEPVAQVVADPALLREPRDRLQLARVRLDAEVAVAERVGLAVETLDLAAEEAAGAVDPTVEAALQAVHSGLVGRRPEAAAELLRDVGLAVAVGVLRVEDIRGGADQHALAPDGHAGRERDLVQKDSRLVEPAIALRGLKQTNPSPRFVRPGLSLRV